MRFFNPSVNFDGIIEMEGSISGANHVITKSWSQANLVAGLHADSANYAELVTVGGVQQLKLKPLTITDVSVDTSAANQAAWITANYSAGTEYQEGDVVILTGTSATRPESYIHNGGSAGTAADWTKIEGADVQASEVRGFLSAGTGISYNSSNGQISANAAGIRGFFSADAGGILSYDASNGVYNLTAATVQNQITVAGGLLTKSAGELSLTNTSVRGLFSAGTNLAYDASSGAYSISDATIRGKISKASGAILSYDASSGVLDLQASTVQSQITVAGGLLSKSAGEITLATAAVLGEFSASGLVAFDDSTGVISLSNASVRGAFQGGGLITYNSSLGEFDLPASTVQSQITVAGGLLSKSAGEITLAASSVRSQISAATAASGDINLLSYNASAGSASVLLSAIRKEFTGQALTANTFATLNHGLGRKFVHCTAYDSAGNQVQLEVQAVDSNNLKVKSAVNVSNLEIVISM
jgi:phage baseplate assembly protein gpV